MNIRTSLLIAFYFAAIFANCSPPGVKKNKKNEKSTSIGLTRWRKEYENFPHGLKLINNKGEVVELTADEDDWQPGDEYVYSTVSFNLYTRGNPEEPLVFVTNRPYNVEKLRLLFDPRKLTFFIAHGFLNDRDSEFSTLLRETYLDHHDVNVIVVDWSEISIATYGYAVANIKWVADKVVGMISFMQKEGGMDLSKLTLVGHSLGAHLFGLTGHNLKGQVGVIVGLDPAFPLFHLAEEGDRLSPSDAKYVQVIHTNAGELGYWDPIGTADFYVGDGVSQVGCGVDLIGVCSHSRAWQIFAESIYSKVGFWGRSCPSADEALSISTSAKHPCKNGAFAKMGGFIVDRSVRGIYHLETSNRSPFALNRDLL